MLRLLVDTSIWLNLARDPNSQQLIAATRVIIQEQKIELLVPALVIEEFDRNRARVEADMSRSITAHMRHARDAIERHGQGDAREAALTELDNVSHRASLIRQMGRRNFDEIRELLEAGRRLVPCAEDLERVVARGLEMLAPFHRAKNSVADALLLEMYRSASTEDPSAAKDVFWFISANTKDFSSVTGDVRVPHADLADLFADERSNYAVSLGDALSAHFSDEFGDLLAEFEFREEPRNYYEIRAAEQEMFDRIWYYRSLGHETRAEDVDELRRVAGPARKRIEAQYGVENLGPYSDFEWGMLNGKLSALRWVTADEWDFLDT